MFAGLPGSKSMGFKAAHFTPGSKESRCLACEGTGANQTSMDFFADVISPCERCGGTGFRDEVMEVRISDKVESDKVISEVLMVPFGDLWRLLEGHIHGKAKIQAEKILSLVQKTGLGHLSCSRTLKTLSAGELQRLKLVSGLSTLHGSSTLFLLDEPTGGLHTTDIGRLLILFRELSDAGHTILCVTHEALLMEAAGKVIELGPGGGKDGGRVVEQTVYRPTGIQSGSAI
ncbi:MAG TPA: hypothetical protein DC042_00965 [Bacteroidales bacterium]|nr:hypothetical protein [Bacteroidales bacterium]